MAKYELLNEAEFDKNHNQYLLRVTVELGKDQTETHDQQVVLEKKDTEKQAQKYADELESELKKLRPSEADDSEESAEE